MVKKNDESHHRKWLDVFERLRQRCPRRSAAYLCGWVRLPYSTLRRWRTRRRRGEPLIRKPGPQKTASLPVAELRSRVAQLHHGPRRSRGSGALYRSVRHAVSRRELAGLIAEERQSRNRERRSRLHHLTWQAPNLAWAIDATAVRTPTSNRKLVVVLARDLATHYHFEPLLLQSESARENADWLEALLRRHRAPLFLKRDNGSPFNEGQVGQTLAENCILPLNSPVCRPQYNGAIEHGIGSFKRCLLDALDPGQPIPSPKSLRPLVRAVIHLHNARPRRSLHGLSPVQAYFQSDTPRWTRRQRHAIFEWISEKAFEILQTNRERTGRHDFAAAWRRAAVVWLRRQHLITLSQNRKLLPHLCSQQRS
ncbi:MAG: DDE-type integrase/transposase/recombinase [Verrucomicrobiae bacterium]|nr:DDE-type integrase/transposase/recombinase [Verrucomicrobiae bacterium]